MLPVTTTTSHLMPAAQHYDLTSPASTSLSFYSTMPTIKKQGQSRKRGTMVKQNNAVIRNGKVHLKLTKHRTVILLPSQLVKYMSLNIMKRAAQSIIRQSSIKVKRRQKRS